ncbi:nuclear transport factor 2 family protein [Nostoc sp. FACHB-973]|uniref:Nuclear transport factor 2 family protein n=1 Tax=Desmonostoc muscorum LEGE 12446 TaxID=1828758 RepID=A0A8J7DEG1_DESMC|nr:nuclear transport factor 2 family protein [Desmonostoc muscorum]MBD2515680.1 nuclear transport factor 2 family protein [Nostoc sp. FACHB-973]MBX9254596.1 nuclear transport factor 2 family protein [Desmonostoc muscorum CCALA 125]MCF2149421.1 nuclear transport factor 2 family protein [Desmonostoc muscorum LEGE 12446]
MTNILVKRQLRFSTSVGLISFLLTLGLTNAWQPTQASTPQQLVQATTAQNAPAELKNLLTQVDAAASKGDVKGVLQFYSPNFTHGDGLNRQTLEKSLVSLWQTYPKLQYSTKLLSAKPEGNAIIAETETQIIGSPSANSNNLALDATIKSRQRVVAGKIVRQDILSERTQLTSGSNPPKIDVKLPQQVKVGQKYNFDAIVQEPLGEDFLLGTALEEPIRPEKYLNPTPVDLQLLTSGGVFKEGQAPSIPGSQWVSAVILRGNGITMVTQRLQVVKK